MPNKTVAAKAGLAVFGSYVMWGVMPLYWKAMQSVDSTIILGHRVVWSVLFTAFTLLTMGKLVPALRGVAASRRTLLMLVASGVTIAVNWFLYIYAVNHGQILQTSLGYFINPLVSVAFGVLFFKEKLRRAQLAAIALVVCAVAIEVAALGELPLMSLGIALSFAMYGVFKKKIKIDPTAGLFFETTVMLLPAVAWLLYCQQSGLSRFPYPSVAVNLFLIGTGIMTSVPLIFFAWGAQRISLTSVGLIQYTSPTLSFLIAVFVYGEPLSRGKLFSFGLIWTAIVLYTAETLIRSRRT